MLAFLLAGVATLAAVTVGILRSSGDKALPLALVWGVPAPLAGLRLAALPGGVHVSDHGVRVVNVLRTVELGWDDVLRFQLAPFRVPIVGVWPTRATAVWLKPAQGPAIQTPLNSQSAEFLGRPRAFQRAFEQLRARQADAQTDLPSPEPDLRP